MTQILIFESDAPTRKAVEVALTENNLATYCAVNEPLTKPPAGTTCLWLSDAPPSVAADNRFEKPLRIGALLDRVRRALNTSAHSSSYIQTIGPYELDGSNNSLTHMKDGNIIRLTEKERHILEVLARSNGERVERRALLDEVWGYGENIETHTLETHIYRLRQKIESDPAAPDLLQTDESGYRLIF